jgi:hypothetical protein
MSRNDDFFDDADLDSLVPPMREKPYYVTRLERRIRNGRYGGLDWLDGLGLDTLKLLDAHHRERDLEMNELKKYREKPLRNVLLLSAQPENKDHDLTTLKEAAHVILDHHEIKSDDLSELDQRQFSLISKAVGFLASTKFMEFAPPRLTHFVMRNPDKLDDILEYFKHFSIRRDQAHSVDLDEVDEFINKTSPALREGSL